MDDHWLFALPKLIALVLVVLFLLALGPFGWVIAGIYLFALAKK